MAAGAVVIILLTLFGAGMPAWCAPATPAEITQWLNAHNTYRALHGVPPVTWSTTVAATAQAWADGCTYVHSGTPGVGENIAAASYILTPQAVVDMWYGEEPLYNYSDPGYYENPGTGHFTQVVWKNTTQIGCGYVTGCAGSWPNIWVCQYSPPGNYLNQFALNVFPPGSLPATYTVSYNANGATSGSVPASQTKTHNVALTLRTNTGNLARTGYTFAGWNTNSSGTGTNYSAGGTYTANASDILYAKWTLKTYTVSYNANNATSGSVPASQTKTHNVALTLRTNTGNLARTGYAFAGWNTNSSGTGTNYSVGGSYTANASDILYAKWSPCPPCSGDNIVIKNFTYKSGVNCLCECDTSITIGSGVVVETGATANFRAPKVYVQPGATFNEGSSVGILSTGTVSVVGSWNLYYDWDCDGSPMFAGYDYYGDGTFSSSGMISATGTWTQVGNQVTHVFSNGTTYWGTLNGDGTRMDGTMLSFSGSTGCWYALRD